MPDNGNTPQTEGELPQPEAAPACVFTFFAHPPKAQADRPQNGWSLY
jgi:hypothetical protein